MRLFVCSIRVTKIFNDDGTLLGSGLDSALGIGDGIKLGSDDG
jgi:hypothetical protein